MKKTLIVNGSPRRKGDTEALINEVKRYLQGEVIVVNTYEENIKPCIDCRYCFENDSCVIQDDMQKIYEVIGEVDNIILASPLYFSELTGQLLNFASRLQLFFAAKYIRKDKGFKLKQKKGALLVAAGGSTKSLEKVEETAGIILKSMNAELIGVAAAMNTDELPAAEDEAALKCSRDIAQKLNED